MGMMGALGTTGIGAGMLVAGGLMSSKGRAPGMAPMEQRSLETKFEAQQTMSKMFQERAKDPFAYVVLRRTSQLS